GRQALSAGEGLCGEIPQHRDSEQLIWIVLILHPAALGCWVKCHVKTICVYFAFICGLLTLLQRKPESQPTPAIRLVPVRRTPAATD
ncbi:MAG: hypothetical protein AB2699_08515, partial [Candidatus Thiodiazotropha taylori]